MEEIALLAPAIADKLVRITPDRPAEARSESTKPQLREVTVTGMAVETAEVQARGDDDRGAATMPTHVSFSPQAVHTRVEPE
jgi:hypothetical protein